VISNSRLTVTIASPAFPPIPPYSRSKSSRSLFLLDPIAGFEPEGELRAKSEERAASARARARKGVRIPPGVPFRIKQLGVMLRDLPQVGFPSSER
jgi:hypothetical protein